MKSLIYCLLIFALCCGIAIADVTIDGYDRLQTEIQEYDGILTTPSVSHVGKARQYFDPVSGKLKCSEDGNAYTDCVSTGAGSGDVVGPSSSTDNAAARFDGTTGKLLQNSLMTISDTGTVNIPSGQTYNINGVPISGGGASSLTGLTDVNSATPTGGRLLIANGSDWDSVAISGDVSLDAFGNVVIQPNSVALGTDTTGNYVTSITNGSGITGGDGGSEGAALTLAYNGSLTNNSDVNSATDTAGRLLVANGSAFDSVAMSGDASLALTGAISLATDSVGTDEISFINSATATGGRLLIANGTDFDSVAMSGDISLDATGSVTITSDGNIQFTLDGGGSAITTGEKTWLQVPFAGTITSVEVTADQSCSIVTDVWVDSYANFPPTNADSICASACPTLSSSQTSQDTTLSGWTTSFSQWSYFKANVDSVATCERVVISLQVEKL